MQVLALSFFLPSVLGWFWVANAVKRPVVRRPTVTPNPRFVPLSSRPSRRLVQNEVLQRCVIPAKAGIQSPGTRGEVWMPAFAGMTLTFLTIRPHFDDLRD